MKLRVALLLIVLTITVKNEETPVAPTSLATSEALPLPPQSLPDESLERADQEAEAFLQQGLAILAANQAADGSFGDDASHSIRLALTSIATLAFLADGHTESRGRYHREALQAVRFLVKAVEREGPRKGLFLVEGDTKSRMHGQGYATLALSQAAGMFGTQRQFAMSDQELRGALSDAAQLIVATQGRQGGWYYEARVSQSDEGSITVCMIQALRGARNAGIAVPPRTIRRAINYIRQSQNEDGAIRYRLHGDPKTSFELTAAGAATLASAGQYFSEPLRRAQGYLFSSAFDAFLSGLRLDSFPYYGLLYAAQALHLDHSAQGDKRRRSYYPKVVNYFTERFDPDRGEIVHMERPGPLELEYGPLYRIAFATLALQVRGGTLPFFQR